MLIVASGRRKLKYLIGILLERDYVEAADVVHMPSEASAYHPPTSDREIMASGFGVMLLDDQISMIQSLISHLNLRDRVGACCLYHEYIRQLADVFRNMLLDPCRDFWRPLSGWQCGYCTCLNSEGIRCWWCQKRPAATSSTEATVPTHVTESGSTPQAHATSIAAPAASRTAFSTTRETDRFPPSTACARTSLEVVPHYRQRS